jgi:predicted permease
MRALLWARHTDRDIDDEISSHLAEATDELIQQGLSPEEARWAARRSFGGVTQTREVYRQVRSFTWLDDLARDLRHAVRTYWRNPGFTVVALVTLALGIGVTTAIFSVVYGVLLRPLPYAGADRIVAVFEVSSKGRPSALADPNFNDFRGQSRSFAAIAKYGASPATVSGPSPAMRAIVGRVSPGFLEVFGVQPIVGRDFVAEDAKRGAAPTVLVSYGYWSQYLGASPDLSHVHLKIDGTSFAVIGALPAGFRFPPEAVDFWVPTDLRGENSSRTSHNHRAVARLRDGVTVEQANHDISAIARRIHDTSNEQGEYLLTDGGVTPLQDSMTGTVRSTLLVLLGAVGFLLLVACANVANLLLVQASARERELALRSALGAGRQRLVRQFLTETFLLVLMGSGLGVIGAFWGVAGLVTLAPASLPRLDSITINVPVLTFALLLATVIATGLSAFTAARATSGDLRESLMEGARGQTGSQGSQRVGRMIVAAQLAITLVLVIGAGLLGRSLVKVLEVDPGFRVEKIVAMDVSLPRVDEPAAKAGQARFFASLIDRLGRIPGVRTVGATSGLPLEGGHPDGMFALLAPNIPMECSRCWRRPRRQRRPRRISAPRCDGRSGWASRTSSSRRTAISRRSAFR